jgi:hypothetical protein
MPDFDAAAAEATERKNPFSGNPGKRKEKEGGESEADRHKANKRPKGNGEGGEGGGGGSKGKDGDEKKAPEELTTLFFGQMPYDTKVEDIVPWLKTILKREGCAGDVHAVRLAGGGSSNKKFKGFAFVDFKTAKAAKKWQGCRVVTPGCQIGYTDYTGCHQLLPLTMYTPYQGCHSRAWEIGCTTTLAVINWGELAK